ncbi:unnamed protein product [Lactuca virosa]|uniref:Fatty acyl-CoA reductase C-terminal domain-containing protein n=1 Tax=Lactuca virosa TaxID=75947 RepID=A0AAU9NJ23_9ASTR|nr:unnamed protein product [Lactuca virosa]
MLLVEPIRILKEDQLCATGGGVIQPYLFSKSFYDDMNTEKLRQVVKENEVEANIFYFDPKTIDWEDYFLHTHLPGAVKHVFK